MFYRSIDQWKYEIALRSKQKDDKEWYYEWKNHMNIKITTNATKIILITDIK